MGFLNEWVNKVCEGNVKKQWIFFEVYEKDNEKR